VAAGQADDYGARPTGGRLKHRSPVVTLALAAACSAGGLDRGEASALVGTDPLGGPFAPALARCEVTRDQGDVVDVSRYDRFGRLERVERTRGDVTTLVELEWDGPCRALQRESGEGLLSETAVTCDDQGWPVAGTLTEGEGDAPEVSTWTVANTYERGRLVRSVRTEGSTTQETAWTWDGDRLARTVVDGDTVTELTWRPDGWIAERTTSRGGDVVDVQTWVYDDAGRLVERQDDGRTAATYTYDGDARWPSLGTYTGDVTEDLRYDCP
jgi:hypothetical protein